MVRNHVHIIKMGGTIEFIDPAYDDINKELLKLDASIESYLRSIIKPHFDVSTESITNKDSRDIDDSDREKLANAISETPHKNIVITHGTFTMRETGKYLEKNAWTGKKIILTGSMIPIIGFATSDAGFNLGFAIASFESIDPGVYLSMNGGIFKSEDVTKNIELFRFE